jgi:hypothetical protein
VGPLLVVIAPPIIEHRAGMRDGPEQHLVQQFIAQSAIERCNKSVLLWLARYH